jgi:S1-C subfamily serine protease
LSYDETQVLDTIEQVSKSVVNISTVKLIHNIFYQAVPVGGMGSGTIISRDGLILTNNHVVGGVEKINVTLHSNQVVEGTIVGASASQDVAVIKIPVNDLPAAQLGDSDRLRVGQRVYAIGNPFGLAGGPSVTSGVISAVNRTIESGSGLIEGLVQTDAAINPGNSGGPLVDVAGRVVAVNTAIIPYAQGIGFAIPINAARSVTAEITTKGAAQKPWLGIVGLTLTPQAARYYNLPTERGVLVTKVASGSPAEAAGMAEGDIILQIANTQTKAIEDLVAEVHKHRAGEVVRVFALRNGRERYFDLKLSEAS